MSRPGYLGAAAVALCLSVIGSVVWQLRLDYHLGLSFDVLLAGLSLAYTVYLVSSGSRRAGQLSATFLWLPANAVILMWSPALMPTLVAYSLLIWITRVASHHRAALPALLDLCLCALALLSALWAVNNTGSLFLALWCFFLVHALYVLLPEHLSANQSLYHQASDPFEQAFAVAEAAARRLSNSNRP